MTCAAAVDTRPLEQALDHAWQTIRRTIPQMGDDRPELGLPDLTYARGTRHFWVEGFWSGQLWLAYAATGDAVFCDAARRQRPYFAERLALTETHDHDMGFLYTLSAVADYKLTGDPAARQIGLAAAEALAARFNPAGQFIRAWNDWSHDPLDNRGRGDYRLPGEPGAAAVGRRGIWPAAPTRGGDRPRQHRRALYDPPRRLVVSHLCLRPGQRRGAARRDQPGLRRRVVLEPRAGLGHPRLRQRLCLHRPSRCSANRRSAWPTMCLRRCPTARCPCGTTGCRRMRRPIAIARRRRSPPPGCCCWPTR